MNCDQVWEIIKRVEAVSHDLNNNIRNIRLGWVVQRLTGLKYQDMENEYTGTMLEPSGSNLTESEKKQKYFWVKSEKVYPNEYEGGDPYFSHTYYSRFEVADRLLKIIGDVDMLTKSITEKETNK
jgi:hypothetical protein